VGKKYIMAITGGMLFGFVIIHLLGNLQIYLGRDVLNHYAHLLKANLLVLWGFRFGLLAIGLIHITTATSLVMENWAARPIGYAVKKTPYADLSSRTMVISGSILFCFIVYHLLHFTAGLTNPEIVGFKDPNGQPDVYAMVVAGFKNPWASSFYIAAMVFLWWHLQHGISSLFQSLGLKNLHYGGAIEIFAQVASFLIFFGNCSIPASILLGLVK
jgi:succinate dehydrogenase / fumarate reductase cytochrome b subunit